MEAVIGEAAGDWRWICSRAWDFSPCRSTSRFDRVIGVESNLAAAKDLEVNLQASGGESPARRHATAEAFLSHWHETPDLVVLDPPRAGVEPEALARLKKLAPWRIQLSFLRSGHAGARSGRAWSGTEEAPGPYEIRDINLFDIFPQTYHMEVLVRLKRRT